MNSFVQLTYRDGAEFPDLASGGDGANLLHEWLWLSDGDYANCITLGREQIRGFKSSGKAGDLGGIRDPFTILFTRRFALIVNTVMMDDEDEDVQVLLSLEQYSNIFDQLEMQLPIQSGKSLRLECDVIAVDAEAETYFLKDAQFATMREFIEAYNPLIE